MEPIVECRDFCFAFSEDWVLARVNFRLFKSQRLTILGPNGCGKSTLLRLLAGLIKGGRQKGALMVGGRAVSSLSRLQLAGLAAWMPQAADAGIPFTVREFLDLSAYAHKVRKTRENIDFNTDSVLELTGLSRLAHVPLNHLSGGQRQRAYAAAAIAQNTPIILLDEPTAFLDPHQESEMNELLLWLNARAGKTIITVTHNLVRAFSGNDPVLLLAQGRQAYFGAAREAVQKKLPEAVFGHEFLHLTHPQTGVPLLIT